METFSVTRRIEIDAAHRVPDHASKCRRLHGHRYVIEATCQGALQTEGASEGMVLDFSFLKEEMMSHIHLTCDHATILFVRDNHMRRLYSQNVADLALYSCKNNRFGAYVYVSEDEKLYAIDCVPTAENLARHWFRILYDAISRRTEKRVGLTRVRVYETPNCFVDYEQIWLG